MNYLRRVFIAGYVLIILITYSVFLYHSIKVKAAVDFVLFYNSAYNFFHHLPLYAAVPWHNYFLPESLRNQLIIIQKPIASLGANYSNNLNPPAAILFVLPFGLLSYTHAAILWYSACFLATFITLALIYRYYFPQQKSLFGYLTLLGIFLSTLPYQANITLGQYNIFIVLGVFLTWIWSKQHKGFAAGFILGLLIATKYFLGLLIIFYFLQRRWKTISGTAISFVGINLIALGLFGKAAYIQHFEILNRIAWYATAWNASILGFFARFSYQYAGGLALIAPWSHYAYYFASVLVLIFLAQFIDNSFKQKNDFDVGFFLTLIASILLSPLGWAYYLILLIFPVLSVVRSLASIPVSEQSKSLWLVFVFSFTLGLLCFPAKIETFAKGGWTAFSLLCSSYFYGIWLLVFLLFYCRRYIQTKSFSEISSSNLLPWTLLCYIVTFPAFGILFYQVFIKKVKCWQ